MAILASLADTAVGGLIAWATTTWAYRTKERASSRRDAADAIVPPLDELMRLVRKWDQRAGGARWLEVTEAALNAIEAETHRLPRGWRHLRRSVRAAIGEATGTMAFADRVTHDPAAVVPDACPTWAMNAEEYFCYVLDGLRTWRDSGTTWSRRTAPVLDFDAWLARHESTAPGFAFLRGR